MNDELMNNSDFKFWLYYFTKTWCALESQLAPGNFCRYFRRFLAPQLLIWFFWNENSYFFSNKNKFFKKIYFFSFLEIICVVFQKKITYQFLVSHRGPLQFGSAHQPHLGTIHILRKHIFRLFEPTSPHPHYFQSSALVIK